MTWELPGKYPHILSDPKTAKEAKKLFDDANGLLEMIVAHKWLTANAVYGLFPANSEGDVILLYSDDARRHDMARFPMLRQQWELQGQTSFRSLADYLA